LIISVESRDRVIWDKDRVTIDLLCAMRKSESITVDLRMEGPDADDIGLYRLIEACAMETNYSLTNITIATCNQLEYHDKINIDIIPPMHLLSREFNKNYSHECIKNNNLKHFGRFVGRSNAPRLFLSTYLDKYYNDKTISTYHFNLDDDYHKDEIGLEALMTNYNISNITDHAKFLATCPRTIDNIKFKYQKERYTNRGGDFSTQLHELEKDKFISKYQQFFVEIVSETFFNGNTFFITEKIFRPILLKTPFIVQGPVDYLKNLRKLGFKTFHDFWDEGYDADPAQHSIKEITKVIDVISQEPTDELNWMLYNMKDILEHNYNTLQNLSEKDFEKIRR